MKKIFWTSIFWIVGVFVFWLYVRLFDPSLALTVSSWFSKNHAPCTVTTVVATGYEDQLNAIQDALTVINKKLTEPSVPEVSPSVFRTTQPTRVALYYFNTLEDQKLPVEQQVNINSLLPVYRVFPASDNLLTDVINELIAGNLTATEKKAGFITEFPHKDFALLSADLAPDGTLQLTFSEVPGFTDGGSARMLILQNVIQKTVEQFSAVKKVVFTPDTLFQP